MEKNLYTQKNPIKLLTLSLVLIVFFSGMLFAQSKAEELYQKGMKYMASAQSEVKDSTAKKENFQNAQTAFEEIVRNKRMKDSPQAIYAQFELAKIKAEASGKMKNTAISYEMLKTLYSKWGRSTSGLDKAGFTSSEIADIKSKMLEVGIYKTKVAQQLDSENSHKLQYKIFDFLVRLTGKKPAFSYWFAIVLISLIVKIGLTPFTNAQMKSMKEMQTIQPLVKELQTKFKDNQQKLGEETMKLYKEHKINPLSGCLPLLIQMPILFYLYSCIKSYEIQFQNGTFFWIGSNFSHNIAIPVFGQQSQTLWFTAANLAEADVILLVVYIISTFISMKFNTTPSMDDQQAAQQKMMSFMFPLMFAFFFAGFPSAFLLYWFVFNVFQTIQQKLYMKKTTVTPVAIKTNDANAANNKK